MASTTALYTGLSGLNTSARALDVIGNNIANVNTTAFKSARMLFQPLFSRTMSSGSAPGDTTGGTNPSQVGMGVGIAAIQRNFAPGAVSATGDQRDLAVEGDGFFIVERAGTQMYTRNGAFRTNAENDLVTADGNRVQGFAVDGDFNIISGELVGLNIPVGSLTIAEATGNVRFMGNLNAAGDVPTAGSSVLLQGTATGGLGLVSTAAPPPGAGNVLEAASRLLDIEDPQLPGSDTPLFADGQTLQLSGAEKGDKALPIAELAITAASTVQDLMDFLVAALGLRTDVGANPDGATPGIALDTTSGVLTITGNTGGVNDLTIDAADLRLLDAAGDFVRLPFHTEKVAEADGESARTTFVVYDSLGTPVEVDLSFVLDSRDSSGTSWRYYVESGDDTDLDLRVATGLLGFDTAGQLTSTAPVSVQVDRAGLGAATPLAFDLSFADDAGSLTSLADSSSAFAATFQDGSPIGTLAAYSVGQDGVITGAFSNGLTRVIGQVALATFTNPEGLVDRGGGLFTIGPNSGSAVIAAPGTLGSGLITAGNLELSNVDLGQEFINLILTTTGYSASSRVIRTTDELLQQLLLIGR